MKYLDIYRGVIVLGLLVLLIPQPAFAAMSSANYVIPSDVLSGGGGTGTSASYTNQGVLGQGLPLGTSTGPTSGQTNLAGFMYNANATLNADGDLYTNLFDNCWYVPNNDQQNYDQDVWGDACDPDSDNDGLTNAYELRFGLNPLNELDAADDNDGDGISNLAEAQAGTDPTRLGFFYPDYQLPQYLSPLVPIPQDGPVDSQRPLPR